MVFLFFSSLHKSEGNPQKFHKLTGSHVELLQIPLFSPNFLDSVFQISASKSPSGQLYSLNYFREVLETLKTRHELDTIWQKVRNENASDADESLKKKNRRKEWLEWYSSSKKEKEF